MQIESTIPHAEQSSTKGACGLQRRFAPYNDCVELSKCKSNPPSPSKSPECKSVQEVYFLPFHYRFSLKTHSGLLESNK